MVNVVLYSNVCFTECDYCDVLLKKNVVNNALSAWYLRVVYNHDFEMMTFQISAAENDGLSLSGVSKTLVRNSTHISICRKIFICFSMPFLNVYLFMHSHII